MSGGYAVKDGARGGASPRLHKRSSEGTECGRWGGPRAEPAGGILDGVGAAGPEKTLSRREGERSDLPLDALGMCKGALAVPKGPKRQRSLEEPGPEGERPNL